MFAWGDEEDIIYYREEGREREERREGKGKGKGEEGGRH
jgi:hypothetical protein